MNKIVAVFLLTLLVHIIHVAVFRDIIDGLDYVGRAAPFGLIYGPFLYISYMVSEGKRIYLKHVWPHFIPLLLGSVFYVYFLADNTFRYHNGLHYYYVLYSTISGSFLFYSVYILFKSTSSKSDNLFVKRIYFYSIILLLVLAAFTLTLLFNSGPERAQITSPVSNSIVFGIMYLSSMIGYNFFLTQFQKDYDFGETRKLALGSNPIKNKSLKSVLSPIYYQKNSSPSNKEKLLEYLSKKTFLESGFNMDIMAKDLKIPKQIVNQMIKSHFNENFIKTINSLRIKEACKELESESFDMNIDELAVRCGFKSRASFYRYFSQDLKCSPMEYREKLM